MIHIEIVDLYPLGENAIVIMLGREISENTQHNVRALTAHLEQHPVPGMIELVPAFTTVTVYYDLPIAAAVLAPSGLSVHEAMKSELLQAAAACKPLSIQHSAVVEIPVCYGEEFGPDLDFVAEHNGLTVEEVISIHEAGTYLTYMIGFAPGFPYLGGMSTKIAAPRRQSPRLRIPAGTVGIAGMQTGVYPLESPGGWQLIGRTPTPMFRPQQWPPSYIQMGDTVKFKSITRAQYDAMRKAEL